jgi:hypothetical protein
MHQTFHKEGKKKKKTKWTVARFSKETKEKILERDWGCILCMNWQECWDTSWILDYHHVLFGLQKEITEDRNNVEKWVCIHREPHQKWCHWSKVWEGIREFCINYLKEYYEKAN